jgi:hypothetical protein
MGEKHGGEFSKNPFKLIKLKSGFTQSYYSVQSSVTKSPFKKRGFSVVFPPLFGKGGTGGIFQREGCSPAPSLKSLKSDIKNLDIELFIC